MSETLTTEAVTVDGIMQKFIEENCEAADQEAGSSLYRQFKSWVSVEDSKVVSQRAFFQYLKERFAKHKTRDCNIYVGLKISEAARAIARYGYARRTAEEEILGIVYEIEELFTYYYYGKKRREDCIRVAGEFILEVVKALDDPDAAAKWFIDPDAAVNDAAKVIRFLNADNPEVTESDGIAAIKELKDRWPILAGMH